MYQAPRSGQGNFPPDVHLQHGRLPQVVGGHKIGIFGFFVRSAGRGVERASRATSGAPRTGSPSRGTLRRAAERRRRVQSGVDGPDRRGKRERLGTRDRLVDATSEFSATYGAQGSECRSWSAGDATASRDGTGDLRPVGAVRAGARRALRSRPRRQKQAPENETSTPSPSPFCPAGEEEVPGGRTRRPSGLGRRRTQKSLSRKTRRPLTPLPQAGERQTRIRQRLTQRLAISPRRLHRQPQPSPRTLMLQQTHQHRHLPGILHQPRTLKPSVLPPHHRQQPPFPHIKTHHRPLAFSTTHPTAQVHILDSRRSIHSLSPHGDDLRHVRSIPFYPTCYFRGIPFPNVCSQLSRMRERGLKLLTRCGTHVVPLCQGVAQ